MAAVSVISATVVTYVLDSLLQLMFLPLLYTVVVETVVGIHLELMLL